MTTYVCPEFAATGIELQIIELQVQREAAEAEGTTEQVALIDAEIASLWAELADLAEDFPQGMADPHAA